MSISDTKLKSILNKPYNGAPELTDGDGLGARISQKGTIAFQFRYRWNGKACRLSVGRYPAVSLKEARIIVAELRELYDKGIDPKTFFTGGTSAMTLNQCLDYWMDRYV